MRPMPKNAYIETTVRCNLDCIMCDKEARERSPDMTLEQFKHIVNQLNNVKTLALHGLGEPLLNPYFTDMVAYGKNMGHRVVFNNNMTVMTEEKAKKLIELKTDEINKELFLKIRRQDLFDKLVRNAKNLIRIRGSSMDTKIKMVVVLLKENYQYLKEIFLVGKDIGVDEIMVQNVQSWSRDSFQDKADEISIFGIQKEDVTRHFQKSIIPGIKISLPPLEKGHFSCTWPYEGVWFTVEGDVCPCCNCHDPRILSFGNIFKKSFNDIWNSEAYDNFRKEFAEDKAKICDKCIIKEGLLKSYT
jgi:MoaA/NifB/PqqE/SkfB family radical SAM enzyme